MLSMPNGLDLQKLPMLKASNVPIKLLKTFLMYSNFNGDITLPSLLNPESSGPALVDYKEVQMTSGLRFESGCEVLAEGRLSFMLKKNVMASLTGQVNFDNGAFKFAVDVKGQIQFGSGDMKVAITWLSFDICTSRSRLSRIIMRNLGLREANRFMSLRVIT